MVHAGVAQRMKAEFPEMFDLLHAGLANDVLQRDLAATLDWRDRTDFFLVYRIETDVPVESLSLDGWRGQEEGMGISLIRISCRACEVGGVHRPLHGSLPKRSGSRHKLELFCQHCAISLITCAGRATAAVSPCSPPTSSCEG